MRVPRMRSRWAGVQGRPVVDGWREKERKRESARERWKKRERRRKGEASEIGWIKASTRAEIKIERKKWKRSGNGGGYRGPL